MSPQNISIAPSNTDASASSNPTASTHVQERKTTPQRNPKMVISFLLNPPLTTMRSGISRPTPTSVPKPAPKTSTTAINATQKVTKKTYNTRQNKALVEKKKMEEAAEILMSMSASGSSNTMKEVANKGDCVMEDVPSSAVATEADIEAHAAAPRFAPPNPIVTIPAGERKRTILKYCQLRIGVKWNDHTSEEHNLAVLLGKEKFAEWQEYPDEEVTNVIRRHLTAYNKEQIRLAKGREERRKAKDVKEAKRKAKKTTEREASRKQLEAEEEEL
ncbi:Protein of unknown function [Pyronema omphalodes CBS 100304]|uniref:Uncharacterized protein n=1 Tax=Pyronema omphalodes (strain CBS 100304) TaxID=1076935 RepID=U4L818_PYROM|nr:Protein of unknown function [Pyronema omphalodes CBS 100304]